MMMQTSPMMMDVAMDSSMVVPSPRYEEEMLQHRDSDWFYQTPRQTTSYDTEKEQCGRELVLLQSYNRKKAMEGYHGDQYVYDEDRDNSNYCVPDVENTPSRHRASPEDENIEEILFNMREAIDGWYHPKDTTAEEYRRYKESKPKISDLFLDIHGDQHAPSNSPRRFPSFEDERIVTPHLNNNSKRVNKKRKVPQSDEEPRLIESSDESEYKRSRKFLSKRSNNNNSLVEELNSFDEEDLTDVPMCGKSGRAQIRKEYFYSKNSKTIFRWTCCGSQAKDHPNW